MAGAVGFLLMFLLSLSPHVSLSISEEQALLNLKNSFAKGGALGNWVPNSSPCKAHWAGVICNNGVISGLHLTNMGLSGKVDIEALKAIPRLRTLSLVKNQFTGPIPDFHSLGALRSLLLTGNNFSGEIPDDFFAHMTSLKKVYLNDNIFSGKIPGSLKKLTHLIELHMENNEFTGTIPELEQDLRSLDLSNNKLEGPIPPSLSNFDESTFEGNGALCGGPFNPCKPPPPPVTQTTSRPPGDDVKKSHTIKIVIAAIFAFMVLLLLYVLLVARRRRRDGDFSVLGKDSFDEQDQMVEVHVPSTHTRSVSSNSVEAMSSIAGSRQSCSKKGSQSGKNGASELLIVNDERGVFGLPDLMKAAAEVLGNGGLGSAYKAVMGNGLSVVVKRMREMNRLGRDGFEAEMRRFGRLRHTNILTPLAYHYRREEKLLISEHIPKGSLLYVLHGDRGICHSELNWPTRLKIIQGIGCGMGFLHTEFASYDLPHGNLKSSNVLLTEDYEPVLNDYAFNALINPNYGAQSMFAFRTPEYLEKQQISPKSDVYCLGVVILEILTGKFPSQYLSNGKGGTDVVQWVHSAMSEQREEELLDPEIAKDDGDSVGQMLQILQIGAACTESDPVQRLDIVEAIRRIKEVQV